MNRKVFVLNSSMTLKDDHTEGILERTVSKQGISAKADVIKKYLGRGVYAIVTRSEGGE
ncbi:MAG: DUF2080 family transposase-associated protein [Thermoplasmatales archaeon]|nr:DUF2080 family transposase-associated protein [Thermoplasmatales archaeon]